MSDDFGNEVSQYLLKCFNNNVDRLNLYSKKIEEIISTNAELKNIYGLEYANANCIEIINQLLVENINLKRKKYNK